MNPVSPVSDCRFVTFIQEGGVGRIRFERPPANSYESGFMRQFNDALAAADAALAIRVVVLESALPKFFCAGADIFVFQANTSDANRRMVAEARAALARIEASGKIFIAALKGHTLGGGLEIALACDLRYGAEGTWLLGLPETKLGLLPGNGGVPRLTRLIGAAKAFELMAAGDNIGPAEAYRLGLLNRLFPAATFEQETAALAARLAQGAPLAQAALKRAVRGAVDLSLADGLALEAHLVEELYDTADAKEGFTAFTQKRPPRYEGR